MQQKTVLLLTLVYCSVASVMLYFGLRNLHPSQVSDIGLRPLLNKSHHQLIDYNNTNTITQDRYRLKWIPFLREIYQKTYDKAYKDMNNDKCPLAHTHAFKHTYTTPMFTCDTDLPKYDTTKNKTRTQIHVFCEGSMSYNYIETVPLKSQFQTLGNSNESRECLHRYIDQHCYDEYPVPNVVHWVHYGSGTLDQLWGAMAFYSVVKIVKPCLFLIHGSHPDPRGYWDVMAPIGQNVVFVPSEPRQFTTRGKRILHLANQADIARIEVLKEFGGVYLDTDITVLKPVDIFRGVAFGVFTDGGMPNALVSNAAMFSRKEHPFLLRWLEHWDSYDGVSWDSHSVKYLTKEIHNTPDRDTVQAFGPLFVPINFGRTYVMYNQPCDVLDAFGVHMYHKNYPKEANSTYIKTANNTLGLVARYLFMNDAENCAKKV